MILGLPWSRCVARFGIRADGGPDGAAEGATEDSTLAATDFVADSGARGTTDNNIVTIGSH